MSLGVLFSTGGFFPDLSFFVLHCSITEYKYRAIMPTSFLPHTDTNDMPMFISFVVLDSYANIEHLLVRWS